MNGKLKGYGKKIQAGILGKVYAKLKKLNETYPAKYIMLSKRERTTKTCVKCRSINQVKLSDRIYECKCCGYRNNRDSHSAYNMIFMSEFNTTFKSKDLISKQESGRDSVNKDLVKNVTNVNETEFNYEVIKNKLCSTSHIKAAISSFI